MKEVETQIKVKEDLKYQDIWKDEIAQYLPMALDKINDKDEVLKKTHVQLQ